MNDIVDCEASAILILADSVFELISLFLLEQIVQGTYILSHTAALSSSAKALQFLKTYLVQLVCWSKTKLLNHISGFQIVDRANPNVHAHQ